MRHIKIAGDDYDVVHIAISLLIEAVLLLIGSAIIGVFVKSDWARAVAIMVLLACLTLGPILFFYGPPWKSRVPQRPVTIFGSPQRSDQPAAETDAEPPPANQNPAALSKISKEELAERVMAERGMARRWEYLYLNSFLVAKTQVVLDWLHIQIAAPPSITWFHQFFSHIEESQLETILKVLERHHLIEFSGEFIKLTDKGREYVVFRGVGAGINLMAKLNSPETPKAPSDSVSVSVEKPD